MIEGNVCIVGINNRPTFRLDVDTPASSNKTPQHFSRARRFASHRSEIAVADSAVDTNRLLARENNVQRSRRRVSLLCVL